MLLDMRGEREPRALVWDLALLCRFKSIYYQREIARWRTGDRIAQLITALSSSGAFVSLLTESAKEAGPVLAAIAAVTSIVHSTFRVPEQVAAFSVLLERSTNAADRLGMMFQFGRFAEDELRSAIGEYHELVKVEAKEAPTPSSKLRKLAQAELETQIGARPQQAA